MALPPGPKQPAALQLLQWSMRPLPFLDECSARFGDIFTINMFSLGKIVFVASPEMNKQVFTASSDTLKAGKANKILQRLLGPSSLLPLDGPEHMRQRRLLLPPFHGDRMQTYVDQIREITEADLERWPVGKELSLHPRMQAITLNVILRAVFGLEEGAQMSHFTKLLVELFTPPPAIFVFLPEPKVEIPFGPYRRFYRAKEAADRELFALIAERRKAPDLAERKDILSLMLAARDEEGGAMSDEELRDELITMIAAGHETTATSLSWAFERILDQPRVATKAAAEIAEVVGDGPLSSEALSRLEYVDAIVKETLRIRPILPLVVRCVEEPFTIGGYELPVGVRVAPCIYLTHQRTDLYPNPGRFYPERFVGKKIDPYAWMPFGGGIRRCIGMAFALYEMKVILATVLARTKMRLASLDPSTVERRGVTLAPSGGTRVVLTERRRGRSLDMATRT